MPLEWSALEISAPLAPPWGGAMPHSMGIILHKLHCDSSHNDEFYLWNQFSSTTCNHICPLLICKFCLDASNYYEFGNSRTTPLVLPFNWKVTLHNILSIGALGMWTLWLQFNVKLGTFMNV
jgi:hypothetical protein